MKRVYIAGPISKGDLAHNVNQATEAFVRLALAGLSPFCPHWSVYSKPAELIHWPHNDPTVMCEATASGNDRMGHEDWLRVDLDWVAAADAVLRLPGESTGADLECETALLNGIMVYHTVEEVVAALTEEVPA